MKKLTASIFTVLLGVVSVNAADAADATKGYVDQEVGKANTAIAAETQARTTAIADEVTARNTAISTAVSAETSARTTAVSGLQASIDAINNADTGILAQSKTYTDTELDKLEQGLSGTTTNLTELSNKVDTNTTEIGVLKGDASTEGSVAKSIADALVDYSTTSEVESKISTATANMEVTTNKVGADNFTQGSKKQYTSVAAAEKIAANAVAAGKAELGDLAVLDTVSSNEIDDDAVITSKIADLNVTEGKLEQNVQTALGLARTAKQNFNELTVAEVAEAGKAIVAVSETNGMVTATVGEITGAGITDGTVLKADLDSGVQASLDLADSALQSENVNWLAKNLNVPTECSDATNYCVLTYNNTGFVWEVIARGTEGDNAGK